MLWGSVIGRHLYRYLKALQTSCTFKMSVDGQETSGKPLAIHCTVATLVLASNSAVFKLQDDPMPQNCCSYSYCSAFTRECSFSDLHKDTETVITFLKEDDGIA